MLLLEYVGLCCPSQNTRTEENLLTEQQHVYVMFILSPATLLITYNVSYRRSLRLIDMCNDVSLMHYDQTQLEDCACCALSGVT
jgi:hypothetical protein